MLRNGIPIGRIFGINLRLHYSWFIIFVLVTGALAGTYFPQSYPNWDITMSIIAGIITSLVFFGSVLAHELMHSVVAQRAGISVQSITLFIFGGISQIEEEPKKPQDEFRIAFAGPLTSLLLGGIFLAVWYFWAGAPEIVKAIIFWLGWINIFLAAFNLVPGFPLDGGRVLRSLLWWRSGNLKTATRSASTAGKVIGYIFIFIGIFFVFTGDWVNGIWLALIGWFLHGAAESSYRQTLLQEVLKGHKALEVMTQDCLMISPDITIERLVHDNILTQGRRCFLVNKNERAIGLITLHDVKELTKEQWTTKKVSDVMIPLNKLKTVTPETELTEVMKMILQDNINQVPVITDGIVVGMIARDNLLNFINLRGELGF